MNVLMAMGIILKDKKDIQWKGLPSSASLDNDQELHVRFSLIFDIIIFCFVLKGAAHT